MEKDIALDKLLDPKFFLESFVKIKGKTPGLIPFILNEAQKDIFNTLNKHSRVIILKARQIGFSSAITGYLFHKTITTPGTNTAIIGYNSDLTSELLDKVKTFYRTMPDSIRPQILYNSKHEISFPAIDSKIIVLPSTETVGRGYTIHNCLSGDTKIAMADNSFKKIKDILAGDIIINGRGGYSPVYEVLKKKTKKKMCNISSYGSDNLILTEDHEVLTRVRVTGESTWKKAGELKQGDYIAYPYFQCRGRINTLNIPEPLFRKNGGGRTTKINRNIPINRKFGEFIGWYLAEGTSSKNSLTLSIHKDEVEKVLDIVNVIRPFVSSIGVHYSNKKDYKGAIIYIYGKDFANFIGDLFGHRAGEKHINQSVWNWGWDVCYGILKGLIDGDGYSKDVRKIQITTISEKLAYSTKRLMVSLRIGLPAVYQTETSRYGVKTQDRFDIILGGKGNYKLRRKLGYPLPIFNNGRARWKLQNAPWANQGGGHWKRGRFYYWSLVGSVSNAPQEEYVYDLVLKNEPHSFLTHAGVVHNCLLTELAFWEKSESKMVALENSVPKDGKIIIESTPNNIGNLYHRMWSAKDNGYEKKKYGWWWHYTQEEIELIRKRINNPMRFAQEYELEFLSSGRPVFDSNLIKRIRKGIYKIGQKVKNEKGEESIVVKMDDDLVMYFPPIPGRNYVLSGDVAEGITGGDYSVLTIFDRETGDEVAFWRGHMSADRFGALINKHGRFYNDALAVVEINNHGLTTVTALRNLQYPQIYFRPTAKMDTMGTKFSDRMGWRTTRVSKPLLIDDFRAALADGSFKIHSEYTIDEMLTFVFNDNGEANAQSGFHDDCIIASAIALQGFKIMYSGKLEQLDDKYLPINN